MAPKRKVWVVMSPNDAKTSSHIWEEVIHVFGGLNLASIASKQGGACGAPPRGSRAFRYAVAERVNMTSGTKQNDS